MEKIPTPVIVGGGAVVALLLVMKMTSGGASAIPSTLGPIPNASADQLALANAQNKASGFASLVQAVTSLDSVQAQINGSLAMEQLKSATLININTASNAAAATQAQIQADIARTNGANQLAAQRAAIKGQTTSNIVDTLINGAVSLIGHFFGR